MRHMKRQYILVALATTQLAATGALAQPADLPVPAAASDQLPAGISVAKTKNGSVYVDAKGNTLYGMDLRALVPRTANGAKYCSGPCLQEWEPLAAPADAKVDASIGANPLQNLQGLGGGGGGAQGQRPAGQAAAPGGQAAAVGGQGQAQGGGGNAGGNYNLVGSSSGQQQMVS